MLLLLRALLFSVGAIALSLGALVYEDEEKKIQSAIEGLWIWLDDKSCFAFGAESRALSWIAKAASVAMDELFGPKIFAVRAFVASVSLSTFFFYGFGGIFHLTLENVLACSWALITIILSRRWTTASVLSCLVGILAISISWSFRSNGVIGVSVGVVVVLEALTLSVLFDFLVISLVRLTLRKAPHLSVFWMLTLAFSCLCVAGASILVPILASILPRMLWHWTGDVSLGESGWLLGAFLNFGDLIFLMLLFLCLSILVAHHAFWPFLARPIYAFQKKGLHSAKTIACTVGASLIVASIKMRSFHAGITLLWKTIRRGF